MLKNRVNPDFRLSPLSDVIILFTNVAGQQVLLQLSLILDSPTRLKPNVLRNASKGKGVGRLGKPREMHDKVYF